MNGPEGSVLITKKIGFGPQLVQRNSSCGNAGFAIETTIVIDGQESGAFLVIAKNALFFPGVLPIFHQRAQRIDIFEGVILPFPCAIKIISQPFHVETRFGEYQVVKGLGTQAEPIFLTVEMVGTESLEYYGPHTCRR